MDAVGVETDAGSSAWRRELQAAATTQDAGQFTRRLPGPPYLVKELVEAIEETGMDKQPIE